jgi:hypothetical protein
MFCKIHNVELDSISLIIHLKKLHTEKFNNYSETADKAKEALDEMLKDLVCREG